MAFEHEFRTRRRRRYRADIEQHDGTTDAHGMPTLQTAADWDVKVSKWPCEKVAVSAGERIRGRQVSDQTSLILFGDFAAVEDVTPKMHAVIDGTTYGIISVVDVDGDRREMRIELKLEQ